MRFGAIADVQYYDADDGFSFDGKTRRHYRGALQVLKRAAAHFSAAADGPLAFAVNLGDLIDGHNKRAGQTQTAFAAVNEHIQACQVPRWLHMIGNHDLYNFSRAELGEKLQALGPEGASAYYAWQPCAGVRVLVLDPYHFSVMWPEETPNFQQARHLLSTHNPNDTLHDGSDWFKGLEGAARRYVPYNGALGSDQLAWLAEQLAAAAAAAERVLIFTHVPLHPAASNCGYTIAYDYEEVLAVLRAAPAGTVAGVFAGHDHQGGYHRDEHGFHHITFKSPLNRGDAADCFGQVALFADRLEVTSPQLDVLLHKTVTLPAPGAPWVLPLPPQTPQ